MPIRRLSLSLALLLAAAPVAAAGTLHAQTLRGSPGAVDRAYRQARSHDATFFSSGRAVRAAARRGELVRLSGNADYRVADASYPYALPATRLFVQRLAQQYHDACGERLVVTSATRPRSLRLMNSVEKTVHPAGMAVDLRRPAKPRCLSWLRRQLLAVEGEGVIDATEERFPPHFHVVVFPRPYTRYAGGTPAPAERTVRETSPTRRRAAARATSRAKRPGIARGSRVAASSSRTYRVRRGDSLWTIARRNNVSVERLRSANGIRSSQVRAGQVLRIPARAAR